MDKPTERAQAKAALGYIIPILQKYNFRWVITGGFACYVYGVPRKLTDIDIDIDTSKDTAAFQAFLEEVKPYITQPLENFVDPNYNNYNFELTYNGQIIDVCPMAELRIFNKQSKQYESFYKNRFPKIETVIFEGFELPLLTKEAIIKNKEMLQIKDKWQRRDIEELRRLVQLGRTMNNKLYIFCGIPFSGKSTLSKEVAKQKGYTRIDLDEVKFDLHGKDITDQDLRQKDWDVIYQAMYKHIEEALQAGQSVVHDTGNFTRYERSLVRQIADKLGVETITVYVDTPKEIAKERLLANRKTNQRFNVTDQEFEDAVAEMEVPDDLEHTIVYKTGKPINRWIAEHFA